MSLFVAAKGTHRSEEHRSIHAIRLQTTPRDIRPVFLVGHLPSSVVRQGTKCRGSKSFKLAWESCNAEPSRALPVVSTMVGINDLVAKALNSLSRSQTVFLQNLPKAELHAHLNGSIPLSCLQELARASTISCEALPENVLKGLEVLERGVELKVIDDFFLLFPAIYALTSTTRALATVTREVLSHFLLPGSEGVPSQCQYMELRTTPRRTAHMTRKEYLEIVLNELEKYSPDTAALLISIDRRMSLEDVQECVDLAIYLKHQGRRVVGVDLCGDPLVSVRTIPSVVRPC